MNVVERLKDIGLHHATSRYEDLARAAVEKKFSYEEFISRLADQEKRERSRRREEVLLRLSNFPVIKTFVGYLPLDKEEANLLFQVIITRYENGSLIITSNKSIVDWGEYLADSVLASALLDRLMHHSYVIDIKGKSFRIKDKLEAGEKGK